MSLKKGGKTVRKRAQKIVIRRGVCAPLEI